MVTESVIMIIVIALPPKSCSWSPALIVFDIVQNSRVIVTAQLSEQKVSGCDEEVQHIIRLSAKNMV